MRNVSLIALLLGILAGPVKAAPILNSLPTAVATIYLDFDGETVTGSMWNNGSTLTCLPSGLSDAAITDIFNRVSEDYRPFNVNITTDRAKFLAAPIGRRIQVIITPTSAWRPGVGGISYVGSFTWTDEEPCFVFPDRLGPNNAKYVAECCSHESGHTLGLSHQSTYSSNCQLVESYNSGIGTGETSWAPIMGNSYYKNMTGWDMGPTPYGCTSIQDNLSIITTNNGFGYRTDDYVDGPGSTAASVGNNSFNIRGIITTNTDKDAFKLDVLQTGKWRFDATPFGLNTTTNNNWASNLDIKLEIYNSGKVLIKTFDSLSTLRISVDVSLTAGTYYLVISGTGNANVDDYGSLGTYTLSGLKGTLAFKEVSLNGNTSGSKQTLSWNIISDDPIQSQMLEYSTNGTEFTTLAEIATGQTSYSYSPQSNDYLYYRLKITSVVNETVYSNIISLRNTDKPTKLFTIPTLVSDNILVTAAEDYIYRLADINGRILATGKGISGANRINMSNKPGGMYILQIVSPNERRTERIVKQ
jgi:hypothetical protein